MVCACALIAAARTWRSFGSGRTRLSIEVRNRSRGSQAQTRSSALSFERVEPVKVGPALKDRSDHLVKNVLGPLSAQVELPFRGEANQQVSQRRVV